jgi:pimeloyl-ACP methyl ester carboxylesterase
MKMLKWLRRILLSVLGLVLLLIIIGFTYEHITRYYIKKAIPTHGKLFDIGDHNLNLNLRGTGNPLVVFESGLDTGGSLVWRSVQDTVSKFTATASYDRAGILWSERGNNPKTGDAIAMELHTLLKKANQNGPYILVGHSLAGYLLRSFVAKYPDEVLGIVFVDVSHPEQLKRFPKEFVSMNSMPPDWVVRFANSIGIVRLFFTGQYPNTLKTDSLNIINNSYVPCSLSASQEESRNVEALANEAGKIKSFGNIPLIVITGTGENHRKGFPNQELATEVEKIWMQMQTELLGLSTDSEQILASKSGHYIQLDQPEVVVEGIRKLLGKVTEKKGDALIQ